jgi:hypothetical protein
VTTDAEITERLDRVAGRLAAEREAVEARLAKCPELYSLVQACRVTFGPLRLSGEFFGKPDPAWTQWPSVKLSQMAPAPPAKGAWREVQTSRSRR